MLDHPIREARSRRLHPIDSWAVGIATALCRHQPAACRSQADTPAIADSGTCGDDIRTITVSLVRHAGCVQSTGCLPYARRLTAPVFCAFDSCDRHINARQSPFYAFISLWLRKNRLPSGKTQALPIQWVGCSRGHVPYRTINKEKRLRWQLLHIALSARKRRKW